MTADQQPSEARYAWVLEALREKDARITALEQQLATAVGALEVISGRIGVEAEVSLQPWAVVVSARNVARTTLATLKPEKGGGE